jgi:hypothetical protein
MYPSTGSRTPDSRVNLLCTVGDDPRGVARLVAADPLARFAGAGIVSTIAYVLLYLLLRTGTSADAAN